MGRRARLHGPAAAHGRRRRWAAAARRWRARPKRSPAPARRSPPLQKTLEAKILPESKTDKALSGLLYFPLEKQKVKDLELTYAAADGKISLRFKQ